MQQASPLQVRTEVPGAIPSPMGAPTAEGFSLSNPEEEARRQIRISLVDIDDQNTDQAYRGEVSPLSSPTAKMMAEIESLDIDWAKRPCPGISENGEPLPTVVDVLWNVNKFEVRAVDGQVADPSQSRPTLSFFCLSLATGIHAPNHLRRSVLDGSPAAGLPVGGSSSAEYMAAPIHRKQRPLSGGG